MDKKISDQDMARIIEALTPEQLKHLKMLKELQINEMEKPNKHWNEHLEICAERQRQKYSKPFWEKQ